MRARYVLSPTHLHEFKSADRIYTQPPVMSLLLSDQKLGSRSQPGSSSHKFMIKGRQTGTMHRGHSWIFRAESYETMLAWFDDIQNLTEKTGEERNAFVRQHARSFSGNSAKAGSDSGLEEDEADEVPYSANASFTKQHMIKEPPQQRPQPGRFPSELSNNQLNGHLQPPLSPSSGSSLADQDLTTAASGLHGQGDGYTYDDNLRNMPQSRNYDERTLPIHQSQIQNIAPQQDLHQVPASQTAYPGPQSNLNRHDSNYHSWMAPAAGGAAVGAAAIGAEEYSRNKKGETEELEHHPEQQQTAHTDFANQSATTTHKLSNTLSDAPERTLSEPNSAMTASTAPTTVSSSEIPAVTGLPIPAISAKPSEPVQEPMAAAALTPPAVADTDSPRVMSRQNTDFSISNLHIPGEYPKTATS
jgi:hypothetical protein